MVIHDSCCDGVFGQAIPKFTNDLGNNEKTSIYEIAARIYNHQHVSSWFAARSFIVCGKTSRSAFVVRLCQWRNQQHWCGFCQIGHDSTGEIIEPDDHLNISILEEHHPACNTVLIFVCFSGGFAHVCHVSTNVQEVNAVGTQTANRWVAFAEHGRSFEFPQVNPWIPGGTSRTPFQVNGLQLCHQVDMLDPYKTWFPHPFGFTYLDIESFVCHVHHTFH